MMKHERLLELDRSEFHQMFDKRSFRVRHRLADHPLFSMESLLELARRIPEREIEWNQGNLPVGQDPETTPANGLSPEETIRRIRDCESWLVLKRVERDPDYGALLDHCLEEMRPLVEEVQPNMHQREAFIFVSSPGAVTPFHMDPELNFLLQVRGEKSMHVWNPDDREVISELDLEEYFGASGHRNLTYRESYGDRGRVFELAPGDGVHVPMAVPHWVQNGGEVSISFSITFRTDASDSRELLYQINRRLRGLGLRPRAVGDSRLHDAAKLRLYDVYSRARRLLR